MYACVDMILKWNAYNLDIEITHTMVNYVGTSDVEITSQCVIN